MVAAEGWVEGTEGKAALVPSRSEIADAICTVQRLGGRVARAYALSFGDNLMYDDKLPTRQGLALVHFSAQPEPSKPPNVCNVSHKKCLRLPASYP